MSANQHTAYSVPVAPAVTAWAHHLMAPVLDQQPALPPAEAARLQQLHDRLLAALHARDRTALRTARQSVLDAALVKPGSPALRGRLRALAWRASALLPRLV